MPSVTTTSVPKMLAITAIYVVLGEALLGIVIIIGMMNNNHDNNLQTVW